MPAGDTRLFHPIVLMGCTLVPLVGCGGSSGAAPHARCGTGDGGVGDAGTADDAGVSHDAGRCVEGDAGEAGWPTTK